MLWAPDRREVVRLVASEAEPSNSNLLADGRASWPQLVASRLDDCTHRRKSKPVNGLLLASLWFLYGNPRRSISPQVIGFAEVLLGTRRASLQHPAGGDVSSNSRCAAASGHFLRTLPARRQANRPVLEGPSAGTGAPVDGRSPVRGGRRPSGRWAGPRYECRRPAAGANALIGPAPSASSCRAEPQVKAAARLRGGATSLDLGEHGAILSVHDGRYSCNSGLWRSISAPTRPRSIGLRRATRQESSSARGTALESALFRRRTLTRGVSAGS